MDKIGQSLRFSATCLGLVWSCQFFPAGINSRNQAPQACSMMPRMRSGVPCLHCGELLLPLRGECFSRIVADLADIRKSITPFIGPSRLDNHPRVMALLTRRNDRIERSAPGAA